MGHSASCTLLADGRRDTGTARLEEKELVFRGTARVVVPLASVTEVRAHEGMLVVTAAGGRRLALEIGPEAEKWAHRIAHPRSRLDKLGVPAGQRVAILGVDDEVLCREMKERGAMIEESPRASGLDAIFFGARIPSDLERLGALARRLSPAGALWLIRRKGKGAPVGEAEAMAAGKRAGLVDVKVVSFSESHSAEKYVIPVAKRARSPRSDAPRVRSARSATSRGRT